MLAENFSDKSQVVVDAGAEKKKVWTSSDRDSKKKTGAKSGDATTGTSTEASVPRKNVSGYKRQLLEKQRVKKGIYKMRERQFKRFFNLATHVKDGEVGDNLLITLERRLDNVVFRMKMALSRKHARQMIVHGHFLLNGARVKSPSLLVKQGDKITFVNEGREKLKAFFDKRLSSGLKVPDWLSLDADEVKGDVLRMPQRSDISTKVETSLIVELYSK